MWPLGVHGGFTPGLSVSLNFMFWLLRRGFAVMCRLLMIKTLKCTQIIFFIACSFGQEVFSFCMRSRCDRARAHAHTLYGTWHRNGHERITWKKYIQIPIFFRIKTSLPTHLLNYTIRVRTIQMKHEHIFSTQNSALFTLLPFTNSLIFFFSLTKCTFNYIARRWAGTYASTRIMKSARVFVINIKSAYDGLFFVVVVVNVSVEFLRLHARIGPTNKRVSMNGKQYGATRCDAMEKS